MQFADDCVAFEVAAGEKFRRERQGGQPFGLRLLIGRAGIVDPYDLAGEIVRAVLGESRRNNALRRSVQIAWRREDDVRDLRRRSKNHERRRS